MVHALKKKKVAVLCLVEFLWFFFFVFLFLVCIFVFEEDLLKQEKQFTGFNESVLVLLLNCDR